jgi:hypothetical protein
MIGAWLALVGLATLVDGLLAGLQLATFSAMVWAPALG